MPPTDRMGNSHEADNGDHDLELRYAAADGDEGRVRALLDAGADVHAHWDAAVLLAALNGHAKIVRLLLEHGADSSRWLELARRMPPGPGGSGTKERLTRMLAAEELQA